MSDGGLKLTTYAGERDRARGRFLADALIDAYARRGVRTSLLLRGVQGFGAKQRLRSSRLLTLSEDLPLVTVAVDSRARIEPAVPEVLELFGDGLVTLETARAEPGDGEVRLTVHLGRYERAGGRPAYVAAVDALHRAGVAGATVLLGVDGTLRGERRRARFVGRNAEVPLMIVSVGDGAAIGRALPALRALPGPPLLTFEGVRVCKRDGVRLAEPRRDPARAQKLTVYVSEQARHDGRPLYVALVRELRRAGARGATALRGIWGYHGDHAPHGDRFWSVRRHVPVVTEIVDEPERAARWFEIVDRLTAETGLVTSELVPWFTVPEADDRRAHHP